MESGLVTEYLEKLEEVHVNVEGTQSFLRILDMP